MNPEAIDNFIKRVSAAHKTNSPEIRMTMKEAQEVCLALTLVLSRNNSLLEQLSHSQDALLKTQQNPTLGPLRGMDGGSFTVPGAF